MKKDQSAQLTASGAFRSVIAMKKVIIRLEVTSLNTFFQRTKQYTISISSKFYMPHSVSIFE